MTDFFEPPPPIEKEDEPIQDWDRPAGGVLPATIPIERIVARNDLAAVYLASVSAFPTGFSFDVFVVAADEESELDPFDFGYEMDAQRTGEIPLGKLRLGFQFSDGSKATNTGKYFDWWDESGKPPPAPIMSGAGGGGDGWQTWHESLWVWPLPPEGKLEFVCEWPAAEIPLTRADLDASAIIEAASQSRVLTSDD